MSRTPLSELIAPDWAEVLAPVEPTIHEMGDFLRAESAAGRPWAPSGGDILKAFTQPMANVRVVIIGQDPYPTAGHAMGLSFSVTPQVLPLPRSLQNIFIELTSDLGIKPAENGDLTPWAESGVLLLNRVLSVEIGKPGSHRNKGWEAVTDCAISALARRGGPLVAILWGRDAQSLTPLLGDIPIIASPHPSPLSASRGFFGSRPFSRANELLTRAGGEPVNWDLRR